MPAPYDTSQATVATIDVGTNTALLLVSAYQDGELKSLYDETRFVRLGQGVDKAGVVNRAAMDRLTDTLDYYKSVAQSWGVQDIVIGATSASRDAANKDVLVQHVLDTTGLDYTIISGEQEATLSFAGVGAGQSDSLAAILTLDIGGGSTEFSLGYRNHGAYQLKYAQSLDIGSVRLTERFFQSQPPSPEMLNAAHNWLMGMLQGLDVVFQQGEGSLIGASGTTTVLAMLEAGLGKADLESVSVLGHLSRARIANWYEQLIQLPIEQVLALNPEIMKGREDVFAAGIFILLTIMQYLGKKDLYVNTWGLRHGLALAYWQQA